MTTTAGASQYTENNLLSWFRGTAFPAVPGNMFIGLFTTPPVNGVVAGSTEVTIGSNAYARFSFIPNTTNFVAPTGAAPATSASGANFVFATPTGTGWGTVSGWAIFDAASAGNMLCYGVFSPVTINNGDTVEFLTGNLTLQVN